jgi:ParB/RepB/Spo0J family partition protein
MNQSYIRQIKLEFIHPNPWQARQGDPDPTYIKELALDIAANGLLQIPIGRLLDEKDYPVDAAQIEAHGGEAAYLTDNPGSAVQLAFGHNRLAAYKWLHDLRDNSDIPGDWSQMPVDMRALTDEQMAVYSWSENEKRRDVTAIERARAIQHRLDSFQWMNRQCAEALGVDHSTISNLLRLLKLPEDLQKAILEGKISERQAQAILPVFEAPTAAADSNSYGYYGYSTNSEGIKKAALEGESSDELRRKVDSYFSYRSTDLAQAEFKLDQLFPEGEGIYCGLCKTCDRRMASRNRCFDKECFSAKENHIHREYLKKASQASGYGILDEKKGGYPSNLPSDEKLERILATKCPNLVLAWNHDDKEEHAIDGYPHATLVCEKRNDSCSCVKGLKMLASLGSGQPAKPLAQVFAEDRIGVPFQEGDNDDYDADDAREDIAEGDSPGHTDVVQVCDTLSATELEDAARQARRDKRAVGDQMPAVRAQLEEYLYQALAVDESTGVLFVVAHNSVWPYGSDLDRDSLYRYIAKRAAQTIMPSSAESLAGMLKSINHHLGNLKLEQLVIEETEEA